MFLVFLIVNGVMGDIIEEFLHILVAISRKMTVRELGSVWAHKHCFNVITVSDGRNYFDHKHYSLFQQVKNIVYFLLGKSQSAKKSKRKQRDINRESASPRYQDLDVL